MGYKGLEGVFTGWDARVRGSEERSWSWYMGSGGIGLRGTFEGKAWDDMSLRVF